MPFRVYDIKNIDFPFSNNLLRFKYLVFSYQKSTLKTMVTEVNGFNTVSTATREVAKSGGPSGSQRLPVSDPRAHSPQKAMFISWRIPSATNTSASGFAQHKGFV